MTEAALSHYRGLTERAAGHGGHDFIVEGEIAVRRLLDNCHGFEVCSVLTTPGHRARLDPSLPGSLPVHVRSASELREIVGFDFHRGCLAHGRPPPRPAEPEAPAGAGLVVVAESISDPRNAGALVRNAMAFGVDLVVFDERGANPFSRQAIRAAMGHCFNVPIWLGSPISALDRLVDSDTSMEVWAAEPGDGAEVLGDVEVAPAVTLLVGNEGRGLTPALLERADRRVAIPMAPGADSMNVAAATAIFLYVLRQSRSRPAIR